MNRFNYRQAHGPLMPMAAVPDRAPKHERRNTRDTPATSSAVHTRAYGNVQCTAHSIGPVSLRIGNTTLLFTTRNSAALLVGIGFGFEQVAAYLGPAQRPTLSATGGKVAALAEIAGSEQIADFQITQGPHLAPEGSLVIGQVRVTAADKIAAQNIAHAALDAYQRATEIYPRLLTVQQWRDKHTKNRIIPALDH